MRILMMIPSLSDGGAQIQFLRNAEALSALPEVQLLVVVSADGVHDHALNSLNVDVVRLPGRSMFDVRIAWRLRAIIRSWSPDVLYSWLHGADVQAYLALLLSRQRVTWIAAERDSSYPRRFRYAIRQWTVSKCDGIIANSRAGQKMWIGTGFRAERIFIVENIWPHQVRADLTRSAGTDQWISVGRLEPQKNPHAILSALAALDSDQPSRFTFVGEGSLRSSIEEGASALGLSKEVVVTGFRSDATELIAASSLLVSASHHEGTPNVVIEAIAYGVPVAVSRIPSHCDLLGEGYPHLFDTDGSPEEIAAVLQEAARCSHRNCLDFARRRLESFTPEIVTTSLLNVFRDLAVSNV